MISRITVLLSLALLTACIGNNTDSLEPHQIIESPKQRWTHWNEETPIDVTEEKIITNHTCPHSYAD